MINIVTNINKIIIKQNIYLETYMQTLITAINRTKNECFFQ